MNQDKHSTTTTTTTTQFRKALKELESLDRLKGIAKYTIVKTRQRHLSRPKKTNRERKVLIKAYS